MFRLLVIAIAFALLTACASTATTKQASADDEPGPGADNSTSARPPEPAVAKPPERPFPDDSLYPLLVAEFALRRRAYYVALDQHL